MKARRMLAALTAACAVVGSATTAQAAPPDELVRRLEAIPGLTVVGERPTEEGFRFFDLTYEQPADHRDPMGQRFEQRLTLLHRGFDRPTVAYTTGYYVPSDPYRAEPTQLLNGNQLSIEYRFFEPSRPKPPDWSTLDIWQAATDQHRIINAIKSVYSEEWITTGQSKGGMTAVYHRRFYPEDVDGTVAYVAPNDVVNEEDSAYFDFFEQVGTPECRAALSAVQREILLRRDEMLSRYSQYAKENKLTFELLPGGMDQALEEVVLDTAWAFWQYQGVPNCKDIPAANAPTDAIWRFAENTVGFDSYSDQGLGYYLPYYYQAATELGSPQYVSEPVVGDLLRHEHHGAPDYVPDEIPVKFRPEAMRDIDTWVRTRGSELMFVNGGADPWSAEPFRLGPGTEDSSVHTVAGANHGAEIAQLPTTERDRAASTVRRWAGVDAELTAQTWRHIPGLDDRPQLRHPL